MIGRHVILKEMPVSPVAFSSTWPTAPDQPSLEPGWGDVFRFHLDQPAISDPCLNVLSPQERERAARFITDELRSRFRAAHIQLRQVLGAYLRCRPGELQFAANEYGKPLLVGETSLHFNLSHSQGLALLAVGCASAIGVDIEEQRENIDRDGIARRFFAPGETAQIERLASSERAAAFLACWTRKEAYIKARGMGLSIPLDSFEVSVQPGAVELFDQLPERKPSQAFSIYEISPGPGFTAALAVAGRLDGLRCWDWPMRACE